MAILSLPAQESDSRDGTRGSTVSDATLNELRPHLIDLSDGRFSSAGQVTTGPEDVDRIFDAYLPAFIASAGGRDVPVMVYAHGGLVDEASGITGAARLRPWWLRNGVYPLFFVWETGLWDAIRSLLGAAPRELPTERGWVQDGVNRLLEIAARPLGAKVWGQMKISAAHAHAADGGARYVAERLARFTREHPGAVRLHAVGHSAGSIFHSYFLPACLDAGGQEFSSLSLLAPAVNIDDFTKRLLPRIGQGHGVDRLAVYDMDRVTEEADNCLGIYRHSLLCMVRASLETEQNTPLLGLQESVQADPALTRLFAGPDATIVWSPTRGAPPTAASTATSHGAFDDDPPTLGSVVRMITGHGDVVDLPAAPARPLDATPAAMTAGAAAANAAPAVASGTSSSNGDGARTAGQLALCVGINEFANLPRSSWLHGCVNDAEEFRDLLQHHYGFADADVTLLTDAQATRDAVLDRLTEAMGKIRTGELGHVVFTFSSHGTQVPDTDGDEDDQADEAFVTYDMAQAGDQWDVGTLIVDDELHRLLDDLPEHSLVDVVLDTCHSGDGLKAFDLLPGRMPRFVPPPTAAGLEATRGAERRSVRDLVRGSVSTRQPVLFAACRPDQTAADAHINGRYNGAFSRYLLDGLTVPENRSRSALLKAVRTDLHTGRFAQIAQLEGPDAAKKARWGQDF